MWCCAGSIKNVVEPTVISKNISKNVHSQPVESSDMPPLQGLTELEELEKLEEVHNKEYLAQGEEVPVLNRQDSEDFENVGILMAGMAMVGLLYLMMNDSTPEKRPL